MTSPASTTTMTDDPKLLDYNAWLFQSQATDEQRAGQAERQAAILAAAEGTIASECFISELAMVQPTRFRLGDRSYIAAHAYVTGSIAIGADCTVNAFTVVRGTVTLGDGVRIGAHTSILGFNHSMAPDRPVHKQPGTEIGITIGDDVWIGSNAVIVDGVMIGSHAVIGAGSVVTKDVAEWAVVAGNPARFIRDRRQTKPARGAARAETAALLAEFSARARDQREQVLDHYWQPGALAPDGTPTGRFFDPQAGQPTLRAHADAVEISFLLSDEPPAQLSAHDHVERLRQNQDPLTGLIPLLTGDGLHGPAPTGWEQGETHYHVLSQGYALDLLGARFEHPIRTIQTMSTTDLIDSLNTLPWRDHGWSAGATVDALGTAMLRNFLAEGERSARSTAHFDALIGWLVTHAHRETGMWSRPRQSDGMLQPVNGYYRATRGTFAQFGIPLPHPDQAIDAVLEHAEDRRHFGPGRTTACNVLDVAHPLWLTSRQSGHRRAEIEAWALSQIGTVIDQWRDGQGFSFAHAPTSGPTRASHRPGLQGTEMWLATLWYLADLCDLAESLDYRPRGVHRPEPAIDLYT
ncbi:acyltransferase [Microbacterium sp. LWH12-1.2]|uniref:acyltransferase n=1 Tax=Microbacterium sp. LWH12-1.2 TaxID=3135259 RepID=UPI00343000C7